MAKKMDGITCPECGRLNENDANYCSGCGAELDPAFDESDEFEDFITLYGPGTEPDNEAPSCEVLYGPSIREPNDRWMDDDFIEIKVPKESKKPKDNGKK